MITISTGNPFNTSDYTEFLGGEITSESGGPQFILVNLRAMMILRGNKNLKIIEENFPCFEHNDNTFCLARENLKGDFVLPDGWEEVKDVGLFLSGDKFSTRVFIDTEGHRCVVSGSRIFTYALQSRITCVLSRLLPWMFDGGLTDMERRIINAIYKDDNKAYEQAMQEIIDGLDLRDVKIRAGLAGFESRGIELRIKCLQKTVEQKRREIQTELETLGRLNTSFADTTRTLSALQNHFETQCDANELMNFFLSSKSLELESVSGNRFTFVVKAFLAQYDDDYFADMVSNYDTILYDSTSEQDSSDFEALLRAIFETNEIKLRVWASFAIDSEGNFSFPHKTGSISVAGRIPHPHLERFSCDGDNGRIIAQRLANQDFVGAVSQCIAATTNLNFYDSTVVSSLLDSYLNLRTEIEFLELPDGRVVSPKEAVIWIKEGKK